MHCKRSQEWKIPNLKYTVTIIIGEHGWLLRVFVRIAEQALCHGDGQVGGVKS